MQGLCCPPSCRCWPRPGPFTPKEVVLLTHLSQWTSSTNLEDWVPFGHEDLIDDLARDTSADRVGYGCLFRWRSAGTVQVMSWVARFCTVV